MSATDAADERLLHGRENGARHPAGRRVTPRPADSQPPGDRNAEKRGRHATEAAATQGQHTAETTGSNRNLKWDALRDSVLQMFRDSGTHRQEILDLIAELEHETVTAVREPGDTRAVGRTDDLASENERLKAEVKSLRSRLSATVRNAATPDRLREALRE